MDPPLHAAAKSELCAEDFIFRKDEKQHANRHAQASEGNETGRNVRSLCWHTSHLHIEDTVKILRQKNLLHAARFTELQLRGSSDTSHIMKRRSVLISSFAVTGNDGTKLDGMD